MKHCRREVGLKISSFEEKPDRTIDKCKRLAFHTFRRRIIGHVRALAGVCSRGRARENSRHVTKI